MNNTKTDGFASLTDILEHARRTGKMFDIDLGVCGPLGSDTIAVRFEDTDTSSERRMRRAEEKRQRRMRGRAGRG